MAPVAGGLRVLNRPRASDLVALKTLASLQILGLTVDQQGLDRPPCLLGQTLG